MHRLSLQRISLWGPVVLGAVSIFTLSSLQGVSHGIRLFKHADKIVHFMVYCIWGFFIVRAVHRTSRWSLFFSGVITFLGGALYAATDELHQRFVPSRQMDIWDWVADLTGLAIAILVWAVWSNRAVEDRREPS